LSGWAWSAHCSSATASPICATSSRVMCGSPCPSVSGPDPRARERTPTVRVAQSWLTETIRRTVPDWEVTPEELDAGFVRVGLEVEEVDRLEPVGGEIEHPLVVGRVAEITELTEF